ncbi:UDP-glucose 4-epimerase [Glaciecola punicea ACAM 611]|uniref:UDP-glucose 4-epimerase n=1 Tax=Glaciecola punicea ACAM 611 TaxID=1121923 RepID=H5TF62_9ALTE|nr:NAD-dependent epimerase/dehydratase family protein [Glaciecola punicea]GAB56989.1 UDP-glucose 4-epimerase [Glaciecola punicea ACAM 611]
MKVLVTGSSGWIGNSLCEVLRARGHGVVGSSRSNVPQPDVLNIDLLSSQWNFTLDSINTVIHCAGISFSDAVTNEHAKAQFWKVNVEAAKKLARKAKDSGVKRFVFLSSAKAMGERTEPNAPFSILSDCAPEDLYGESKLAAERAIQQELLGSNTELVCIRPPLVYGAGVKANFRALMNIAQRNLPLPLGSVKNKRSFIALDNLNDFIATCVEYPDTLNETFLISDGIDVSTKELLVALTRAYGKNPRLLPAPVSIMRTCAEILGKKTIAQRLFGNLQLDVKHSINTLAWQPPVSFEDAINAAVAYDAPK